MKEKLLPIPAIEGELYITAGKDEGDEFGDVILSGDPKGLRSLAAVLIALAEINQNELEKLPGNESEHIHLDVGIHIGMGSLDPYRLILSRLDMKNGGLKPFYLGKIEKERKILESRYIK